jgi:predicted transcriptional regulator
MNQQQILQLSRNILSAKVKRVERSALIKTAMANGRNEVAAKKASTMRLSLWSRNQKSAI